MQSDVTFDTTGYIYVKPYILEYGGDLAPRSWFVGNAKNYNAISVAKIVSRTMYQSTYPASKNIRFWLYTTDTNGCLIMHKTVEKDIGLMVLSIGVIS